MKYVRALVVFKDAFPIDMLRHDGCYPVTEKDSHTIIDSLIPPGGGEVLVEKRVESKQSREKAFFTKERWESFGATLEVLGYY